VLIDASVTAGLVNIATHVVNDLGYAGIVLMMAISQVIIIPGTEATMLFSGFGVDTHHFTMVGIIVFGVIGDLLGASIAFYIGYTGLHEVLERRGVMHVSQAKLDRVQGWFDRWGNIAIPVGRLIPVFRSAPPYAAGVVKMAYPKFLGLSAIGSLIWVSAFAFIGKSVGHKWPQWKHHLDIIDYIAAVIIVGLIAWWLWKLIQSRRATPAV
jgi:membrane protein DedA with SNARE-associated domain